MNRPLAPTEPSVVVGIALVRVDALQASIDWFGARFLERVLTAKEAARKVLGPDGEGLGWRAIDVARAGDGAPRRVLHDDAVRLATRLGRTPRRRLTGRGP